MKETVPSWRFDLEACLADFETIRDLNPATLLYIHFEPHSSPEALLAGYEEVLTGWVATVETKREELGVDDAIVEHFVNETEMDDVWGREMIRPVAAVDVRGVLDYLDEQGE